MAQYTEYHPLKFWLDPASIAEIVAHIQAYLVANPINNTTEIETIIHDYLIAHPELIGGVDSVNGQTGEVVLTADNISAGESVTIKDVLDSLQDQINDIVISIPSDYQQLINDVSDLKSTTNAMMEKEAIKWRTSSGFPTGWRTGYFTKDVGEVYGVTASGNYARSYYLLRETDLSAIPYKLEFTPPTGYGMVVKAINPDTSIILAVYGSTETVNQKIEIKHEQGVVYGITIGKFNGDSGTYAASSEFINQIAAYAYSIPKKLDNFLIEENENWE